MKKNKYVVFAMIGFELIALILVALWAGSFLASKGYDKSVTQSFCVLAAFGVWFFSLIVKLKGLKKDD